VKPESGVAAGAPPAEAHHVSSNDDSPGSLLSRPAVEVARVIALGYLAQAVKARPRLDDPGDPEGLHDFRVALRRLRSCLRAFRPELESTLGRRLRRRLRRLADATGERRDLQVHLAWVEEQLAALEPGERAAALDLIGWMGEREQDASDRLNRTVRERFPRLRRRLERRLAFYPVPVSRHGAAPLESAGAAVERALVTMGDELAGALAQVHAAGDDQEAHLARIAAKRLRYLLEPFADELPEAARLIARLKSLQDALGDLHDTHVFAGELGEMCSEAGRGKGDDAPPAAPGGFPALTERLIQRGEAAFTWFEGEWLKRGSGDFFRSVELAARAAGQAGMSVLRD
jgi:CHAD domain-containing protein